MGGVSCCCEANPNDGMVDVTKTTVDILQEEKLVIDNSAVETEQLEAADEAVKPPQTLTSGVLQQHDAAVVPPPSSAPVEAPAAPEPILPLPEEPPSKPVQQQPPERQQAEKPDVVLDAPNSFTCNVSGDSKLGFHIGYNPGDTGLHVINVDVVGRIPEWNKANPDKQVLKGAKILAINGIKMEPNSDISVKNRIVEACKEKELSLVVQRALA
mmetsp:Transcript_3240/g.7196  ORF Transcript_3240/g.7196 Transcript_3240/m.7196 type:complete len:213 (+) Transcript_3240:118-756(+)